MTRPPEERRLSCSEALRLATARLAATSDTPRLDAELLMAHSLGISREALLLGGERATPAAFSALVNRRAQHEPVAYITGTRAFWTIELAVAPGVLIPRPDSETLIEAAVAHFGAAGPATVLDLGTGSGALLLAALAEWPAATGTGVDRSPAALAIAAGNAVTLGMSGRARFVEGGWNAAPGLFDLILCNPPYIRDDAALPRDVAGYEPASALFAGPDGLDDYRRLAPIIAGSLPEAGIACLELGAGQAPAVAALMGAAGLAATTRDDLSGHARCLIVSRARN
jgi:release factor glutamine methyltransferase